MKTEYFTLKEDGVIVWAENMPEKDSFIKAHGITGDFEVFHSDEYNAALQSAISNAIEVSNQEEVKLAIGHDKLAYPKTNIFPLLCGVEKKQLCEINGGFECPIDHSIFHKTVALVTFSEPEIRTALCIQGHPDGLTKGKVYNVVGESDKFFDIKPDDFGHLSGFDKRYFSEPSSGVEETQEELKIDLWNKVIELLMFCEADGTVVNGYRSQEIINQLRDITRKNK